MKLLGKAKNRVLLALICALALALGLAFGLPMRRTANADVVSVEALETTINNAPDDGEYVLQGNVEKNITLTPQHDIVLDLGMHTIKGQVTVEGTGSLTIKNGKITGPSTDYVLINKGNLILGEKGVADANLTVDNEGNGSASAIINYNTLTIESGTYTHNVKPEEGVKKSCNAVKNEDTATKLTINDGTFNGIVLGYNAVEINGGIFNETVSSGNQGVENNASLTITGGTFKNSVSLYGTTRISGEETTFENQVHVWAGTTTIENGKFTYNADRANCFTVDATEATAIINGGTYASEIQTWGSLTVNGGEFMADIVANRKDTYGGETKDFNGNLTVHGGIFHDKLWLYGGAGLDVTNTVTIDPSDNVKFTDKSHFEESKQYFKTEGSNYLEVTNADGSTSYVSEEDIVATVEGVQYSKVGAAIANATEGQTVKLIKASTEDIVVPAKVNKVTLDLNGFTITGTGTASVIKVEQSATLTILGNEKSAIIGQGGHYVIENHGTLTLGDEAGDHNGFTVNSSAGVGSSSTIANKTTERTTPKITIYGGTYGNKNDPTLAAIKSEPGTKLYVKGGTFGEEGSDRGGQLQIIGEAEISDGTFYSIVFSDYQTSGTQSAGGNLTITDGKFQGQVQFYGEGKIDGGTFQSIVVKAGEPNKPVQSGAHTGSLTINRGTIAGQVQSSGSLIINGGEFTFDGPCVVARRDDNLQGTVAVHGGTFSGAISGYNGHMAVIPEAVTIEPTTEDGVKFTSTATLPDESYFTNKKDLPVADGKGGYISGDTKNPVVAYIDGGNIGYSKLQDAINDAKSGNTVVLSADSKESVTVNFDQIEGEDAKTLTLIIDAKLTDGGTGAQTLLVKKAGTLYLKGKGQLDGVTNAVAALYVGADSTVVIGENSNGIALSALQDGLATDKLSFTRSQEVGVDGNSNGNSYYTIVNTGKLTIENAEVMKRTDGTVNAFGALIINMTSAGHTPTLTINGGEFGDARTTVKTEPGTKTYLNGGTFAGQICDMGSTTITKGEFDGIVFSYTGKAEDENLTITGGKFNAEVQAYSETTISGGEFNADVFTNKDGSTEAQLTITGGTFAGKVYAQSEDNKVTIEPGEEGVKFTETATLPDVKYFAEEKNIPVADGEGNYVSKSTTNSKVVAYIGSVGYEELQAALDEAAKNGGTVTLADNITDGSVTVSTGNVKLDLATFTITGSGTKDVITVNANAELTIIGGEGSGIYGKAGHYTINNLGTLNLGDKVEEHNKFTVDNTANGELRSSTVRNAGSLVINGGNYINSNKNTLAAVKQEEVGSLTVNGGTFGTLNEDGGTEKSGQLQLAGKADIHGGTFNDIVIVDYQNEAVKGNVTITDGTFTSQFQVFGDAKIQGGSFNDVFVFENNTKTDGTEFDVKPSLTIEGGTFNARMQKLHFKDNWASANDNENVTLTIDPGDDGVKFTDGTKLPDASYFAHEEDLPVANGDDGYISGKTTAVAYIGNVGYTSVAAALNAATGDEAVTVTLVTSISEDVEATVAGANVTLDLNGATLTGSFKLVSGKLTIKNGAITGNGSGYVIENHGTLTLGEEGKNEGSLTVNGGSSSSSLIANKVGGSALTVLSGTYTSTFIAIKNETGSTLTIEGGTFTANGADNANHLGQAVQNWGTAALNGGTYNGIVSTLKTIEEIETAEAGGTTTVKGGTYTKISGYVGVDDVAYENMAVNSQISIEGEITVKEAPYSAYVKTGWVLDFAEGGNFTVKEGTANAAVSANVTAFHTENAEHPEHELEWTFPVEYHFETLGNAFKYVKEKSGSPKLLNNLVESITIDFAVTLNLGGHSITGVNAPAITVNLGSASGTVYIQNGSVNAVAGYPAIQITQGKVSVGNSDKMIITGSGDAYAIENHGTLEFNGSGVQIQHDGEATQALIYNAESSEVTFGTGSYSSSGILLENHGTATIGMVPFPSSSNFRAGTFNGAIKNEGTMEIKAGTFKKDVYTVTKVNASAKLTVTGGTFEGKLYASTDGTSDSGFVDGAIVLQPDTKGIVFTNRNNIPNTSYYGENQLVFNGTNYVLGGEAGTVVASIGGVGYTSVAAAIKDAAENDVIVIADEVTEDVVVDFANITAKKLTLTINGKLTNVSSHTIEVKGTGTLNLLGTGTVDNTAAGMAALHVGKDAKVVIGDKPQGAALMSLDGTKLTFTHSQENGPVIENSSENLTINDAEVLLADGKTDSDQPLIVNNAGARIAINGGTYGVKSEEHTSQRAIENKGTATLNGGTYNGEVAVVREGDSKASVTVRAGNFNEPISVYTNGSEEPSEDVVAGAIEINPEIKDHVINFKDVECLPDEAYFADGEVPEANGKDGSFTVVGEGQACVKIVIEAGHQEEYFESFEAAFAHIENLEENHQGTIEFVLTNDVTENIVFSVITNGQYTDNTFTLDLNGHKITGKGGGPVITVNAGVKLTITNSAKTASEIKGDSSDYVIKNEGTLVLGEKGGDNDLLVVTNTGEGPASTVVNLANGDLTINSGTYTHNDETGIAPGQSVSNNSVKNNQGGTLTINGGEYTSRILSYGNTDITGGTFKDYVFGGTKEQATGSLDITGGTFEQIVETHVETTVGGELTKFNAQLQSYGTTTVSDGTFTQDVIAMRKDEATGTVKVEGGKFKNSTVRAVGNDGTETIKEAVSIAPADGKTVTFTDGNKLPDAEYFTNPADLPVKVGENEYVSGDKEHAVAAHIEGKEIGYASLQEALDEAAKNGGKVILDANVEGDFTVSSGNFTLDLNGKTITGAKDSDTATITVNAGATLKIVGNAAGSAITGTNDYYVINNLGTLTIEGEKLVVENPENGKTSATSSLVRNAGKLTIKNGIYTSRTSAEEDSVIDGHFNAVKNEFKKDETAEAEYAELYIEGGTFNGLILAYGNAEISGGEFNYLVGGGNNQPNPEGVNTEGKLTIKGGTFNAMVQTYVEFEISGDEVNGPEFKKQIHVHNTGTISGGKFGTEDANGVSLVVESGIEGEVTITGGIFDKQIQSNSALVVEGGTFKDNIVAMRNKGNEGTVKVTGGNFECEGVPAVRAYDDEGNKFVSNAVVIEPAEGKQITFKNASSLPDERCYTNESDIPVQSDKGFVSGSQDAVAHIGSVGYTDLQAALEEAAKNGGTVVLADHFNGNIDFNGSDKAVTLDLNGKTVTGKITVNSGNLTVTNGIVQGAGNAYVIENKGTLTLKSVQVKNTEGSEATASLVANKSGFTLTVVDSTLASDFIAIKNETNSTLTVQGDDTQIGTSGHRALLNYGTATIEGGTFHGNVASMLKEGEIEDPNKGNVKLTITGGTFEEAIIAGKITYADGKWGNPDNNANPDNIIEVKPATQVTFKSEKAIPAAKYFDSKALPVKKGKEFISTPDNKVVAAIGSVGYTDLQTALNDAKNNETVTLLAPVNGDFTVEGGKSITLDLNGNTITGIDDTKVATLTVAAETTLFIKSSVTGGKITGTTSYYIIKNEGKLTLGEELAVGVALAISEGNVDNSFLTVDNTGDGEASTIDNIGELVINSGTYNHNVPYVLNQENVCNAVKNEPTATSLEINGGLFKNAILAYGNTTINGGTFEQPVTGGNNVGNDGNVNTTGKLTITGGDFKSVVASYVEAEITGSPLFEHQVQLYNKGTISGGTFTTKEGVTVSLVVAKNEETANTGDVTITDGEFNQQVQAKAGLKIEGGTFNSSVVAMREDNNTGKAVDGSVTVTGGTFKDRVFTYKVPEDYSGDIHDVLVIDPAEQVKFEFEDSSKLPAAKYFADGTDLPVKIGEEYISGNQNVVASVGSVGYTTLQAALDAAKNGETIKLAASTSGSFTIEKDITIDFGEFFLNGDGTSHTLTIASGHEVTLTGTTGGVCGNGNFYTVQNFGTLTIENGVYKNENATHTVGGTITLIANKFGGTLTIKDGTFSGMIIAVKNETEATLTIEDGTFTGTTTETALGVAVQNWGKAELKGGTYEGIVGQFNTEDEENSGALKADANKKLVIKGGEYEKISGFIATGDTIAYENPMFSSNVSIEGEISVKNAVPAGYVAKGYSLDMIGDEESFKVVNEEAVASANSIKPDLVGIGSMFGTNYNFSTVADAIAFASKHSTGSDVNVSFLTKELTEAIVINDGKDYTFTLNGGTLTVAEGNAVRVENGSLTLRADNETIISTTANRTAAIYVAEGAKLSLGVKLTVQGPDDYYVIENHGELDLTNAAKTTIKNTNKTESNASLVDNEGTLTVGNTTVAFETDYVAIKNATNGTLTINGGTFTSDRFAVWSYGEVTINGGTFDGEVASVLKANDPDGENNDDVKLTITAGTFNGAINGYTYDFKAEGDEQQANDPAGVIEIAPTKAGDITLSEVPNAQYFATNWVAEKQGETYKVVEGTYYAMIDGVGYTTLQAALDEALDGQTVTVLANVKEDLVVSGNKNITLDLGTHTITGTGEAVVLTVNAGTTLTILGDKEGEKTAAIKGYAGNYTIENHGTLTIGDEAKEHAAIAVDSLAKDGKSTSTVQNFGTLTINGGTYTNSNDYALAAIKDEPSGTITINGGTFGREGEPASGQVQIYGKATINDGIFNAIVYSDNDITDLGDPAIGDLTVKNGTFNGNFYAFGKAKIDGGTFNGNVLAFTTNSNGSSIRSDLTINGGTFSGMVDVVDYNERDPQDSDGMLTVAGGTFVQANVPHLASKDLALEKVVVIEGGKYVIKNKSDVATGIVFGRSATEFEAGTLAEGRVCYRTDDGAGDWLVVTIEEFKEIAKNNITEFHKNLVASQVYSETGKAKLQAILDEALEHIEKLTDVKEINTHLETAKANMRAVLNDEQEKQLQEEIKQTVEAFKTFAKSLNSNFGEDHAIVKAEIDKIKAAESMAQLTVIKAAAESAVRAFHEAIESSVREFQLYAVTQGINLDDEEHSGCKTTYSESIRGAKDYDDLAQQLADAKSHVDTHVMEDRNGARDARKTTAKAELKAHAESLGFTISDTETAKNIDAYNAGIAAIEAAQSLEAVNDALAKAELAVTDFANAIEREIENFVAFALEHGVDFSATGHTGCYDEQTAVLKAAKNAEELAAAVEKVQKHVLDHMNEDLTKALEARKKTAKEEVEALGTDYPDDDVIKDAKEAALGKEGEEGEIDKATTIDEVNAAVEKAKAAVALQIVKLKAIADLDEFIKDRLDNTAKPYVDYVAKIKEAADAETINEYRGLALAELADLHNNLLAAEARVRAYATNRGITLTDAVSEEDKTTRGDYLHNLLWEAKEASTIETQVETAKSKIDGWYTDILTDAEDKAVESFQTWAEKLDPHFTSKHKFVEAQVAYIKEATDVTEVAARLSNAQNALQNLLNVIRNAASELNLYALRSGINLETHQSHIDEEIEKFYNVTSEEEIPSLLTAAKTHIDDDLAKDEKAALGQAKANVREYLEAYVKATYGEEAGAQYLLDSKVAGFITAAVSEIGGDTGEDPKIKTREELTEAMQKVVDQIDVRIAQIKAVAEVDALATSLFNRKDFVAYTEGVAAIEAADSLDAIESARVAAIFAVEEFHNAVENGVLLATNYAISHGIDVNKITTEFQAIRSQAKNNEDQSTENSILNLVKKATDKVDKLVTEDEGTALSTRKGTAKEELENYAKERFPDTYANIEAYTNGVSKIDDELTATIEAVNDVLTKAMGEIDVYYNLYLDALLALRTHSAAHGHDLGDDEHTAILEEVTNLLKEAKNAEELETKAEAAKAKLDEHIQKHDDEVELAEYIEDKVTELKFYAIEKGVSLEDTSVTENITAIQAVTLEGNGDNVETAKASVDTVFNSAKEAINAKAAEQATAAEVEKAKATAEHSLQVYAATKGIDWDTEVDGTLKTNLTSAKTVENVQIAAKAIKNAIDTAAKAKEDAAALEAAKQEAETELKLYAASKDVEWKSEWTTSIEGASAETLESVGTTVKTEIDEAASAAAAAAALAAKKSDAEQKLKLYAATKGVEWDNAWTTQITGAADEGALTTAEGAVKTAIDTAASNAATAAALTAKKAEAEQKLKLYAATKGVEWDNAWTTQITGAADESALTAAENTVKTAIDTAASNAATAAALTAKKAEAVLELKLYAASVGVAADSTVVTEEIAKINAAANDSAVTAALTAAKTKVASFAAEKGTSTKYLVVFIADGKVVSVQSVLAGADAEQPADPDVYGKTFKGWKGTFTNVNSDLVIEANFEEAAVITEAKQEITDWLNSYLDDILKESEVANVVARLAETDNNELLEKLKKVYSEENAELVYGYYNEALAYLETAENEKDVEYAKTGFKNNVASVEILQELVNRPVQEGMSTGEIVALVILAVSILGVLVALEIVIMGKKRRDKESE